MKKFITKTVFVFIFALGNIALANYYSQPRKVIKATASSRALLQGVSQITPCEEVFLNLACRDEIIAEIREVNRKILESLEQWNKDHPFGSLAEFYKPDPVLKEQLTELKKELKALTIQQYFTPESEAKYEIDFTVEVPTPLMLGVDLGIVHADPEQWTSTTYFRPYATQGDDFFFLLEAPDVFFNVQSFNINQGLLIVTSEESAFDRCGLNASGKKRFIEQILEVELSGVDLFTGSFRQVALATFPFLFGPQSIGLSQRELFERTIKSNPMK